MRHSCNTTLGEEKRRERWEEVGGGGRRGGGKAVRCNHQNVIMRVRACT